MQHGEEDSHSIINANKHHDFGSQEIWAPIENRPGLQWHDAIIFEKQA